MSTVCRRKKVPDEKGGEARGEKGGRGRGGVEAAAVLAGDRW